MSLWSMTGFVTRSRELELGGTIALSLKSLNHKGFECSLKMPQELQPIEQQIRNEIRASAKRGKIECLIYRTNIKTLEDTPNTHATFKKRIDAFISACSIAGFPVSLDSTTLYRLWNERDEIEIPILEIEPVVITLLKDALEALKAERAKEGDAISKELQGRISQIAKLRSSVEPLASGLFARMQTTLSNRLAGLSPNSQLPEQLRMEIASIAKSSDVAEEISRIEIHEKKIQTLLLGQAEGVGREIDFVCQELLREWNTLSVKAQDATISQYAVSAKLEIERIREQAANVG